MFKRIKDAFSRQSSVDRSARERHAENMVQQARRKTAWLYAPRNSTPDPKVHELDDPCDKPKYQENAFIAGRQLLRVQKYLKNYDSDGYKSIAAPIQA